MSIEKWVSPTVAAWIPQKYPLLGTLLIPCLTYTVSLCDATAG